MIIDDLPSISIANDSDEIAIEQGTATKKITKGNFLQEVTSAISSLLSSLSGKVSKAGDTMTGDLILQNASCITQDTRITSGTTPSSNIYGRAVYLNDSVRFNVGTWQIMALTNGCEGFQLVAGKKANNVNKFNYIRMLVDANGDPVVELSNPAAWRTALGLCYAANDTFSITSSVVLTGLIGNTAKTTIYLDCVVDRSMENISTISVTAMTGYIVGTNGRDTSGNTDYTGSGFTLSCTKQGNHHVRIGITKTSAFPMGDAFTPVTYFGTLTLKFT